MTLPQPTDLSGLTDSCDLKLVAVDMDGTLLDDDKNFPDGLWELLDELERRGIVFAPASGRQATSLQDLFPGHPDLTVIGENGAIVLRGEDEISSSPVDHVSIDRAIDLVREAVATGIDGGLVMCGKKSAYVERTDDPFVEDVMVYYHRTAKVADQHEVLRAIERGEIDDDIVKLAVMAMEPVAPLAERTLALFADTHQYAISQRTCADLQMRGVDKGGAVRALQRAMGITPAQTVVFGDFHNDISMFAEADWSFAMASGHEDVLAAARYIAPSNNEGGVVTVLRTLLGPN